jgi:dTDP-4-dehydrorhamnose reductase
MRILVLGSTGMLGNAVVKHFVHHKIHQIFTTVRTHASPSLLDLPSSVELIEGIDMLSADSLESAFAIAKPDIVINCIGIIKQVKECSQPLLSIRINSLLPHRIALLCSVTGSRFIHFSTDCVFSGKSGMYRESDAPDSLDLYGRSKLLGEVVGSNALTIRTSLIGRELNTSRSLIDWFLSQQQEVKGFTKAIFSGLPTVVIARLISDVIIPNPSLSGLLHISADPISKYDLLNIVKEVYCKQIEIIPDSSLVINRSLDSTIFRTLTGFEPPSWSQLIQEMYTFA